MVREVAAGRMALIEQTGRVDPHYQAVRAAQQQAAHVAAEALARAKAARARPASKREPERREPPTEPARWSPRAFVVMLTDTDYWWAHYDPGEPGCPADRRAVGAAGGLAGQHRRLPGRRAFTAACQRVSGSEHAAASRAKFCDRAVRAMDDPR